MADLLETLARRLHPFTDDLLLRL
ncbi:hypothetical protein DSM3645_02673 [Blastopirellula marina DSM 3645]|uniref:Uncharacterized protein n=1 Tax=Blastopirellula marina DSM 3645 TaxID=314230 RepID=A3ZVJ8_9BACT|nr:hypothetical protein DSM3645_02673 [Blastopirellula marina DSM 3645]